MTIPEAVSLVLQAGAMADKGKVFLLDMGKPVSIIDLARQMIRLVGPASRRGHRRSRSSARGRASDCTSSCTTTPRSSSRRGTRRSAACSRTATPDPATLFFFLELLDTQVRGDVGRPAVATLLAQMLRRCGVTCQLAARVAERRRARRRRSACSAPRDRADRPPASPRTAATDGRTAQDSRRCSAGRRRSRPPCRSPGRPGRRSNGSGGASSRRTTAACSRTARSSPSSRSASPNGSASRTSSRSARAPRA